MQSSMLRQGLLRRSMLSDVYVDAVLPHHLPKFTIQNPLIRSFQRRALARIQEMLDLIIQISIASPYERELMNLTIDTWLSLRYNHIIIIMIIVSIISLLVLTGAAVQVSPFTRTLYTPVNMYRSINIAIQVPILQLSLQRPIPLALTILLHHGMLLLRYFIPSLVWLSLIISISSWISLLKHSQLSLRRLLMITPWNQWVFASLSWTHHFTRPPYRFSTMPYHQEPQLPNNLP